METNPYALRYDLLQMASNLLMEEWNSKRNVQEMEWHHKVNCRERNGDNNVVPYPDLPPVPSIARITELAAELNAFVSRRS